MKLIILTVLSISLLSSCAQIDNNPNQSFNSDLTNSYESVKTIRTATASAVLDREISVDDAARILLLADQAKMRLDSAQDEGNTPAGANELQQVTAILSILQHDKTVPK